MLHRIRKSLTARITLWVSGTSAVIMGAVVLMVSRFTQVEGSATEGHTLMLTALLLAAVSIVVLFLLVWWVVWHHLNPLRLLADSAQRIADGKLEERVPDTGHKDEIGQLQNSFAVMQRSLSDYIAKLQQQRDALNRQNEELEAAYSQAREADGVKARVLSRMSAQMTETVEAIDQLTQRFCDHHQEMSKTELMKMKIEMNTYTDTVTRLLDHMVSPNDKNLEI